MQTVSRIYKICDLSSFVFDHNSTKDSMVWHNILYISHSINPPSVLEITACFQLLRKPPHTFTRNLLLHNFDCYILTLLTSHSKLLVLGISKRWMDLQAISLSGYLQYMF